MKEDVVDTEERFWWAINAARIELGLPIYEGERKPERLIATAILLRDLNYLDKKITYDELDLKELV